MLLVWRIFNGKCAIKPDDLFVMDCDPRTRGHTLKLRVPRCNLEVRKRFFSCRVVQTWNSLSGEAVTAASVSRFKSLLRRDLGHRLYDFLN